jgi:hypothetical protein
MAYTTINKSTDYFNTVLYTGNGGTNAITGVGFQPDWVSIKRRSGSAANGGVFDVVRGVTKLLSTSLSDAEDTRADSLTAFGTDGFTLGADSGNYVNTNSETFVSWNWKAGNSQGSSNTDGSVNTTYTSVNTTAGFSISSFTTPSSGTFTVGHGLGVAPKWIIYRPVTSSGWQIGHDSIGWTKAVFFDTQSQQTSTAFGNTDPTNTVWTGNSANVGGNASCIAYCFAEKTGYSKFGSYTGNGNADGTFVYTGFKPAFVMVKRTDNTSDWQMQDNKRIGYNINNYRLSANLSAAETTSGVMDLISNGFKFRGTPMNTNGGTFIYMAFGQSLVGSNNVPSTAR